MDDGHRVRGAPSHVAVMGKAAGACPGSRTTAAVVSLALVFALGFSLLIAWGMNFCNVDLMLGLSAGRDVWQGQLAQPDRWSFTGEGRIWIDQGWLSHFAYYTSYVVFRQWGPVLLKGLLLASCLVVAFFRCRWVGASVNATLLALIGGALGMSTFLGLRAENLGVLLFVLLSSFLVAPCSWGLLRQAGCLVTLSVWSNAHGSFALGLVLVAARALVPAGQWLAKRLFLGNKEGAAAGQSGTMAKPLFEVASWAAAACLCVLLAGYANPFGTANLRVPLHQVLYGTQTALNPDWLPLLDWASLTGIEFFYPLDATPFLVELGIVCILAIATVLLAGGPRAALRFSYERADAARSLVGMEVVTSLITVAMAFSLRRAALFAALALVPLLAFLFQTAHQLLVSESNSRFATLLRRVPHITAAAAAVVTMVATGWIFVTRTLPPYLPGNPFLADGPPTTRFLDVDFGCANVAEFMKANGITGRVFSSWELEGFLIFRVPEVQVLAGTRAQSYYSPETIEDYLTIQSTQSRDRESVLRTLELLDTYQVAVVVLRKEPRYLPLELALTLSADWANIYRDSRATVMIRSNSERCRTILEQGSLDSLEYPDPRAKIVADAYLAQFVRGWLQDDALEGLKRLTADRPDPDIYWLLGYRGTGRNRCLDTTTRAFFRSEAQRLANMDFMTAEGAQSVVGSLLTLNTFLDMDGRSCPGEEDPDTFAEARLRWGTIRDDLLKKYVGRVQEGM